MSSHLFFIRSLRSVTSCLFFIFFPFIRTLKAQPADSIPAHSLNAALAAKHWDFMVPVNLTELDSLRSLPVLNNASADELMFDNFSQQMDSLYLDLSDETSVGKYITNAEILNHSRYYIPANSLLLEAMGDRMFEKLSGQLKSGLHEGKIDQYDPKTVYYLQRLADNNMFIDIRVSNWRKILQYAKEGRFRYIFHKLTTTYLPDFLKFLSVLLILVLLFWFRKNIFGGLRRPTLS